MKLFSQPLSLRRMTQLVFVALIGASIIFTAMSALNYVQAKQGHDQWQEFRASNNRSTLLTLQVLSAAGYGGMIHNFKNYVIRGNTKNYDLVQREGGTAMSLLEDLRGTHTNPEVLDAIGKIEAVMAEYLKNSRVAHEMMTLGFAPEEIDKRIKIDDGPALQGIAQLMALHSSGEYNRFDILLRFRDLMGYGGIVHQVKNYVLRKDKARSEKVLAMVAEGRELLARYRTLLDQPGEAEAIETLSQLLDTIEAVIAQISAMAENGADAKTIDNQVKWDDGPALAALDTLGRALETQSKQVAVRVDNALRTAESLALALTALILAVFPALAFFGRHTIYRSAVRPAAELSEAMEKLAKGDTSIDVSHLVAKTEVGGIAAASAPIREAFLSNAQMSAQARKDAEKQRELAEESTVMAERQTRLQGEVADKAVTIRSEVESISAAATDLSYRSEQQAATLENSVAALEDLTGSVSSVAESAKSAQGEMGRVAQVSEVCSQVLANAVKAMEGIVVSSTEVSKVTEVIEQIAFQTNLLALNAGVEAARAGDAGRGFSVVATEVLALAQRSTDAANEIKTLLDESRIEIDTGSQQIREAGESFSEIAQMIASVREMANIVAQSTEDQSLGLRSLNESMGELDQVTQQNAAMFEETATSTQTLLESVNELLRASMGSSSTEPSVDESVAVDHLQNTTETVETGTWETFEDSDQDWEEFALRTTG